ncbi:MAG TPA: hypothetical protein VF669_10375 [Tepidisphaeraceae bacterium]|jgi:hypothetical protein
MIARDLQELVDKDPFEPFRIRLVNGDSHDLFYPQNIVVTSRVVTLVPPDQNWVIFPVDKIASIESLIADYEGHTAAE